MIHKYNESNLFSHVNVADHAVFLMLYVNNQHYKYYNDQYNDNDELCAVDGLLNDFSYLES